ncbi:c-type cytochrome [Sulfurimonas sp. MAG313]|nr:c-type cytochrome [Sulfurimonas sp. MAG313]MDF1880827.1 c-type cytochrome [Sulfurimonas sp. MAG313]
MKNLWIFGVVLFVVLMAGTYAVVGDMMGDDIVNILTMAFAAIIVLVTILVVMKYIKQMKNDTASGELVDESWDGLREYNNDIPVGWAVSTILLMIWGMWYMTTGYPLNEYSQIGEYNKDAKISNDKIAKHFAQMSDTQKLKMGEGVFAVQCAPCHGPSGNGQENYSTGLLTAEDLTTRNMSKTYVSKVLHEGSNQLGYDGGMPDRFGLFNMNSGNLISDEEISVLSSYIANGFKDAVGSSEGRDIFTGTCISCHGAGLAKGAKGYKSYGVKPESDETGVEGYSTACEGEDCIGHGVSLVGPSLRDYNSCLVANLLKSGKKEGEIGVMPAFGDMLSMPQIKALSAFVAHGTDKEIEE